MAASRNGTYRRSVHARAAKTRAENERKKKAAAAKLTGEIDYTFLFLVILLLCAGLIMLLSASAPEGSKLHDDSYFFFKKQLICVALGVIGMWVISRINYGRYRAYIPQIMFVCTLLLLLVLIPGIGVSHNGSRRWLNTPIIEVQPSEFMKPVIAMYFALLIERGKYDLKTLQGNSVFLGMLLVVIALLMFETHLSGSIVIAGIAITVMVAGGTPIKPIIIGLLIVLPIGIIGVHALSPVRWNRIMSFMHPFDDMQNTGYQVAQGLYAIGSGGIFGLGLGQSVQKYSYLPEPYNDFIFAIVCEELGLVGAIIVILLFTALILRIIRIAMNAPDLFSSLTAIGIAAQIAIQTMLNIAVATSSVPNTGIALPFFSYGGTAILTLLLEMGVLLNISRYMKIKD